MTEIMTLSDFKKAIEDWGKGWGIETEVKKENVFTFVFAKRRNSEKICVARIFNDDVCVMEMNANSLELRHTMRRPLFEIVTKFANTWPADRKDKEKKYLLRFKSIGSESYCYLNYNKETDRFGLDDSFNTAIRFQTYFSLKEIEEIKNRLDIDPKDFELIEVEEDVKKY